MAKFFNSKDLDFLKTISEEVVDYVVAQYVTLFKVSVGESKTNLYGESLGRVYHEPANLMCIVDREPMSQQYEGFGPDARQVSEFRFNRQRLRTQTLPTITTINGNEVPADAIQNTTYGYPEIGDVILFDETYFEITKIVENKLIGGLPDVYDDVNNEFGDANLQIVATGVMVRRSQVQIVDRVV